MSGVELATAWIRLVPSMEGVQDTLAKEFGGPKTEGLGTDAGKKYSKGVGAGLGGLAKVIGGAFIVQQVSSFIQDSVAGLSRIETINAQTASAIAATGGAANITAGEVEALALSIEGATATEAEAVQEGANMLLTFKNLKNEAGAGNDIFNQSVTALTDMSRAMGSDPKTAAIQLGKALNDPVAGISALSRVGIQFTDDQKALIESLVESGDVMGAQKIILGELNSQFGGSGAAYAATYEGQVALLSDSFGDLVQTVMSAVMPALNTLVPMLTGFFTWLGSNQGVLIAFATVMGVVLVAAFFAWAASIWASTVALLANPVTWIILAIVALIAILVLLVMNWDAVVAWVTEIWSGFIAWMASVGESFAAWWNGFWDGFETTINGAWASFTAWVSATWNGFIAWIQSVGAGLAAWWTGFWAGIGAAISGAWTSFTGTVSGVWNGFIGNVKAVGAGLSSWWNGLWTGIATRISSAWSSMVSGAQSAWSGFDSWLRGAGGKISSWWNSLWSGVGSFFSGIWNGLVGTARSAMNRVLGVVNDILGGIERVASGIAGVFGGSISLPRIPGLAEGATVKPRAGGTLAILAEAGRAESVVDTGLMNRALKEGLPGEGDRVSQVHKHYNVKVPRDAFRSWNAFESFLENIDHHAELA